MRSQVCVPVSVCRGETECKRRANLSDLIKHLAALPLTYSKKGKLGFSITGSASMSLSCVASELYTLKFQVYHFKMK